MASNVGCKPRRQCKENRPRSCKRQQETAYSLNCFDPRYPLGYPLKGSNDFAALRKLCDAQNAQCLALGGVAEFWLVSGGRYVYPPEFVRACQTVERQTTSEKICPTDAA